MTKFQSWKLKPNREHDTKGMLALKELQQTVVTVLLQSQLVGLFYKFRIQTLTLNSE
jgi:hypothetical protein